MARRARIETCLTTALCLGLAALFFALSATPTAQSRPVLSGWAITHAPAANTVATITRAATANQRHIADCVSATLTGDATAPAAAISVVVNLRDGATGAGTILQSWRLAATTTAGGAQAPLQLCDLGAWGSTNTAMTLEFAAAGGANTFETVALRGHDE